MGEVGGRTLARVVARCELIIAERMGIGTAWTGRSVR